MMAALIHRRMSLVAVALITPAALPGCHPTSSVPAGPAPAEKVNVGYGEQSREQTGGAVQSVTGEELKNRKAARVEELLEGRFPGVHVIRTPGGGFSIRIRGVSTFLGDKGPLYVINGIPVEVDPRRGLDWLSPSEIERIDVLKDPAETSMYGVRGANGVILITTKRPR
ncbi:MAG: TonB-dependent receptor plug domain-containing protein [Gemmatimonadetes bacterium]|nr:TonB-dependent receptor plug domain-containing protein [Gemmatimonadota bacterium]